MEKYLHTVNYKKPHKYPVRLENEDGKLVVYVFAKFSESLLKQYKNSDESSPDRDLSCKTNFYSYADAICEGIIRNWNGTYLLKNDEKVCLDIKIIRYNGVKTKQRYLKFRHEILNSYSFVKSPFYRSIWGLARNRFHLESAGLNWSPKNPGTVYLKQTRTLHAYQQIAAHEFGHVLGIGDAYNAAYRFFYDAPGTNTYMMYHNSRVNPVEVAMMLKAQQTGKMQYFPIKFSITNIIKGIKENHEYHKSRRASRRKRRASRHSTSTSATHSK